MASDIRDVYKRILNQIIYTSEKNSQKGSSSVTPPEIDAFIKQARDAGLTVAEFSLMHHEALADLFQNHQAAYHPPDIKAAAALFAELVTRLENTTNAQPAAPLENNLLQFLDAESPVLHALSRLFEHFPYYVYFKDTTMAHRYVSEPFSKLLGRPMDEIIGRANQDLFRSEVAQKIDENDALVFSTGQPLVFEESVYIEGQANLFLSVKFPIKDQADHVIGLGGVSVDIDARSKRLSAAEAREHQLQKIFENVPVAVIISRVSDGEYLYINDACSRLLRLPKSEVVGYRTPASDAAERRKAYVEQLRKTGFIHNQEHRILRFDGTEILVYGSAVLIDYQGEECLLSCFVDLSERNRMVDELRQSQKRYELITNNISDVIVVSNAGGMISYVSPSVTRLTGYEVDELLGTRATLLTIEADRQKVSEDFVERIAASDRFKLIPHRLRTKSGEIIWIESMVTILRDESGAISEIVNNVRDVTIRQKAFEQLKRSEHRYRALFEQSHDAIFLMDLNGGYLEINDRAAEMLGYTLEELKTKHAFEIAAPDEYDDALKRRDALVKGETVPTYERHFIRKDGTRIPTEVSLALVRDEYGTPIHIQSVVRDMTDYKALLSSVEEKQRFIEHIADAVPDIIYVYDVEKQRNVYSNREISTILGYTPQEMRNLNLTDILHPDDLDSGVLDPARFQKLAKGDDVLEAEYRMRHREGNWIWLYSRDVPFARDADGSIQQVLGIAQDITIRKWLESQLVLNTRAIYASSLGIAISDAQAPDYPLIFVNPAFEQMTGYSFEEAIDRNPRFLQGDDQDQPELDIIRAALRSNTECTVTLRNYTKDGRLFWNQLSLSPIFDDKDRLTYYLAIQNDVTLMREAEASLEKALQQEQELNRIRTRFVSKASHEFKTPLAIIRSTAETLRDHLDKMTEEHRLRRFQTIDDQIMRLIAILDDVLHVSRMQSGKVVFRSERVNLYNYVRDYVEVLSPAYPTHRILLQSDAQEMVVDVDKDLFNQILSNLLTNAIKYSPDADRVEVTLSKNEHFAHLTVRDYGIGIPEPDQQIVFSGFQRASNVGIIKGTGLGLSIVQQAVQLHQGDISVTSKEQEGTTIFVRLPLAGLDDEAR